MGFLELFLIAVGLSMDAFAVAVCTGLSMQQRSLKKSMIVGLYFGSFQAVMPLIGYFLGSQFADKIVELDHWVAFILLAFIGARMIKESFEKDNIDCIDCIEEEVSLDFKTMFPLAVATSIDALAVGISFAFLSVRILPAVTFIGVTTFLLSMLGVRIGNVFGARFEKKAELLGGVILILIGLKILLEHTVL
ncbi:MAG TPA: manganese efflux pump MntP family protein [Syntrophomonadaceae bacterium]|jgi:putative Mn2+ efflux pump MntP|nr:manganese efflux pump [Syntrophomonadaceae bacterium]HOQ09568.1 manganese efflux pump MntP family protein [Syntrophomonadaceae bacterium]HPU48164.1 manganese efflux pump MntP family protein [Syntrophomonadaceae bacterium]